MSEAQEWFLGLWCLGMGFYIGGAMSYSICWSASQKHRLKDLKRIDELASVLFLQGNMCGRLLGRMPREEQAAFLKDYIQPPTPSEDD